MKYDGIEAKFKKSKSGVKFKKDRGIGRQTRYTPRSTRATKPAEAAKVKTQEQQEAEAAAAAKAAEELLHDEDAEKKKEQSKVRACLCQ